MPPRSDPPAEAEVRAAEDQEWIRQALAGRLDGYENLVRRYRTRVISLCVSFVKNQAEAEDAAQDVFLKAYQSLRAFRAESSFYTWIYRIAANHCLSLLRKKKKFWPWFRESDRLPGMGSGASAEDPRQAVGRADLVSRVLESMNPRSRLILVLRETEGLSYEQIAEVLGVSLDGVRARLRRAREEAQKKARHFLPDAASNRQKEKQ